MRLSDFSPFFCPLNYLSTLLPFYINIKTLNFTAIKGLVFIEKLDSDGDKMYALEIHTNKNEEIYLWSSYDENEANNLANEIRRIANFRLIEQRLPPTQNS